LNLLFIGGTQFVGRHIVEAAIKRGHRVTLFHRGHTNPDLFPHLERILGDRAEDLDRLAGRRWDAVIDTCGYLPEHVRVSAQALRNKVESYLFISTISVYADFSQAGLNEEAELETLGDPNASAPDSETYGARKVLCEQQVNGVFQESALIIRPGLIVGPHDPTDRFTYWVRRIARGGQVLLPAPPDRPLQFIDGRDLADWAISMLERAESGTFHATGPEEPLEFSTLFETCREVVLSEAAPVWVDEGFLLENGFEPWSSLPLWAPEDSPGLLQVDVRKAVSAGLVFRPLAETIEDTLLWDRSRGVGLKSGLSPDIETAVLDIWHKSIKS
jgi:2'-hydroxyisoflavone reductase